jgi:iron complex outermembrane recepter protein
MSREAQKSSIGIAVAAVLGFASLAGSARAQEPAAEGVEEIVVTAQRREQSLQDVPIAISVVSPEFLNKVAAENLGSLNGLVPGLSVGYDSPTQPHFSIRGISASDFGVGTDPSVGVYVDGVYSARSGAALLAFNDIERIEVLKGPQGTLFGRNTAAGAISIVTKQPTDAYEGDLLLRVGNYGKQFADGMLNLPVGETMALRLNLVTNTADGWVNNALSPTGEHLMPERNWAGRLAWRWSVSDDTTVTASWLHDAINQLARPATSVVPNVPGQLPAVPANPLDYINPIGAPVYNDIIGNGESRKLDEVTLAIEQRYSWGDFKSTTSWRGFSTFNLEDETGTGNIATYFDTANIEHNQSWYQEFKLNGKNQTADWVVGTSYYSENAQQTSQANTYTDSIDTLLLDQGAANPFLGLLPGNVLFGGLSQIASGALGQPVSLLGQPWEEDMHNDGRSSALSAFGDVIWHLSEHVNLTTGVRLTHDEKSFTWLATPRSAPGLDAEIAALTQNGFFNALGMQVGPGAVQELLGAMTSNLVFTQRVGEPTWIARSWNDVSPRAVIDWKVTPDTMLYASATRGYKAGGFDAVQPGNSGQAIPVFAPEHVWNYEAGIKTAFPGHHLALDVAIYQYTYNNKQDINLVCSAPGSCLYQPTVTDQNAYGLDFDLRWQATRSLDLALAAAWIDQRYSDNSPQLINTINVQGQPVGTPRWSVAATVDYVWTFGSGQTVTASLIDAYQDASRCNTASLQQGGCMPSGVAFQVGPVENTADAKLGWASPEKKWGASLYCNNLANNRYVSSIDTITAGSFGTPYALITPPRLYGLELHAHF